MSTETLPLPTERPRARWTETIPFWICHLIPFAAIWTGVTWESVVLCIALYWIRMFGVTAGYHRYFSHRSFKTSRWYQFCLAWLAQSSAQKGALWWAAHHRHHHKHSDQPGDVHSPVIDGVWYAHVGWLFAKTEDTHWDRIRDLSKYPELVWLNRLHHLPAIVLGVVCYLWLGWSGLLMGFFLSTVLLWHGTFLVNSLTHVIGERRFETSDDSRNNWLIAFLTLGEGWHNNHHHYQSSTRQGFYWWEFDVTYYVLKAMSWVGLVWKLRQPPERVLAEGRARDKAIREEKRRARAMARPGRSSVVPG